MEKPVTLKDIADRLNVSITTVSKALNSHPDISKERRKEILDLVEKLNYVPNTMAKNLRSRKTKFISLIVSDNANPYYARVIRGVEEILSARGYHTLIFNNNEDPEKELQLIKELRSINVAGVIITPALGNNESVKLLKKFKIPYVLAHRYIDKRKDNYVIADDTEAGYIATRYLLENRHEKVLFINGNPKVSSARDRYLGYMKALEEKRIEFNKNYVYDNGIRQEDGYKIAREIVRTQDTPFSLLCFSDYVATGAMKALNEFGINMPTQVALMGIDDIDMFSYMHPGLSTVHIPKRDLGMKSAELLLNMIDDDSASVSERQIILSSRLVIRDSA